MEDAEDLDDVRVVQAVQDDDLAEDPARGVDGLERIGDPLQGNDSARAFVERLAHRAEGAAAEERDELVAAPDLPRVHMTGILVLQGGRREEGGGRGVR